MIVYIPMIGSQIYLFLIYLMFLNIINCSLFVTRGQLYKKVIKVNYD